MVAQMEEKDKHALVIMKIIINKRNLDIINIQKNIEFI